MIDGSAQAHATAQGEKQVWALDKLETRGLIERHGCKICVQKGRDH